MNGISLLALSSIAAIILVASGTTPGPHGATGKADSDSIIMARHVRSLQLEIADLPDGMDIDDAALDSVLNDIHASIPETHVTTSPDGKLKFYVITEDFCGAYCHYEFVSYVHRSNGSILKGALDLRNIDSIYLLPDGKYLLIQSWGERAFSACSNNAQAASVLSLEADSLISHPAIFKQKDGSRDTAAIEFRTSFAYYPIANYITYDRLTHTISYQYGKACGYTDEAPKMHTGTFAYRQGIFVQVKDSTWIPVLEEDK